MKLTSSLPLLWIGPGFEVEWALGDELGRLLWIHTIILELHLALLVAGQIIRTTIDNHLDFTVIFISTLSSILRLVVVVRITIIFNLGIDFSFVVNLDRDFWYVRGSAEEVGMSDSKLILEVTFGKRFTATIRSI